ncbi:hypothetical protein HPB52_022194 [Rhipicephalus sanguineus]|uniref:Uncharacterized protein n=1 Tax=Rhipicephalus sanguineus TaxID=34632 RepID=A0A9D4PSY5_RHISA|nr:hypothetical protein HPB52_022194 [Rhipicephalus sanguineus]
MFAMAKPRMDPNVLDIADIIRYPAVEEAFLREIGLTPRPSVRRRVTGTVEGRPATSEYWGICKDLGFNPGEPGLEGEVVTCNRRCKEGSSSQAELQVQTVQKATVSAPSSRSAADGSQVVQIDECLMRGRRRKANRGRLLTGDNVPPRRRNNYGVVSNKGPWTFGMLCVHTKELRLLESLADPNGTPMKFEWHTVNCIVPATGANTQSIEIEWQKATRS